MKYSSPDCIPPVFVSLLLLHIKRGQNLQPTKVWTLFSYTQRSGLCPTGYIPMVSIYNFNCNCVSQDSYDTAFFSLDLTSLICPAFQHRPVIPSFCLYNPHNLNGCACSRTLNWLQEVIIMTQQAQQEIALARYGAIAPLISGQADNYKSNKEFYDAVSLKGIRYLGGSTGIPARTRLKDGI